MQLDWDETYLVYLMYIGTRHIGTRYIGTRYIGTRCTWTGMRPMSHLPNMEGMDWDETYVV